MEDNFKSAVAFFFLFFLHGTSIGIRQQGISYNARWLCVRAELETQKLNMETQFNNSTNVEDSTSPRLTQNTF